MLLCRTVRFVSTARIMTAAVIGAVAGCQYIAIRLAVMRIMMRSARSAIPMVSIFMFVASAFARV